MSIIPKEIKIYFISNFQKEKIEFDLNLLYYEEIVDGKTVKLKTEGLNKLPYFTLNVKYPKDILLFNLKTYQERVEFFFDVKKFKSVLTFNTNISEFSMDEDLSVIAEHNVMTMIELLFPTKFTVINNFHTSYDHIYDNSSLPRMLFNPITEKNYSYLKLSDGKIYTFIRLVWMNDLLNHPRYREFIDKFVIFWNWYKTQTKKFVKKENELRVDTINKIVAVLKEIVIVKNQAENQPEVVNVSIDEDNDVKQDNTGGRKIKTKTKSKTKPTINSKVQDSINALNTLMNVIKEGNKDVNEITDNERFQQMFSGTTTFDKNYKSKINSINKEIDTINKNIKSINEQKNNKGKYVTLIEQTSENYSSNKFPEYINFINSKSKFTNDKYSYPKYISNNDKLKEFFDNIDKPGMTKFFQIFEKIYNIYIAGIPEKLNSDDSTILKNIMNTSVNINYLDSKSYLSNDPNASSYEIYIMADFIKGKVDDKNSNEIFCPYVGDYLGNMFELLFQLQLYGKTDKMDIYKWDITRNRVTFSIEEMELKAHDMNKDINDKKEPKNERKNREVKNQVDNNPKANKRSGNGINIGKFIDNVYSYSEITNIVDKLKKYQINIDQSNVLSIIRDYNNDLYNIISDYYNDEYNQNTKLLEKIIKFQYEYKGKNEVNNNNINRYKNDNNYNQEKVIEIEKDILKNELYIEILKKLNELENIKNKNYSVVGGTKKRRVFKKKIQTRKIRQI